MARLSLAVALSIVLVAMGAAYQSARHVVRTAQDDLTAKYTEQMDTLESIVLSTSFAESRAGHSFDLQRLIGVIAQFNYGTDVTQISFRDTSDMAAYSRDISIELKAPLYFARWCGLETIDVNRPLVVDGAYHGLLSLSMSPVHVINQAWEQYRYLVRVMSLSLVIVLFSIWVVLNWSLRPLLSLAAASRTMTEGDLSVRVEIAGSPEMRAVLSNFNQVGSSFQATVAALRESETQLSNALIIAHLGPWTYDVVNDLFLFNDHFYAMLRITPEQVSGYTMPSAEYARRFVHPDDMAMVGSEIQKAIATDDPGYCCELEHRAIFGDGTTGYVAVRILVVKDAAGRTVKTHGVNQDITEQKRAEEELRFQSEIMTNMAEAVYLVRMADGTIVYTNPGFSKMFGYEAGEILGKHVSIVNAPTDKDPQETAREMLAVIGGQGFWQGEVNNIRKDGTRFWCQANVSVFEHSKLGRVLVAVHTDITERVHSHEKNARLEGELRQSQKVEAIGRLAGGVAHDFNTLTAIVLGYAEMLLGELPPEDSRRAYAEQIVAAGRRSAALTRQLLAFSRKQTLQPEVLDLNALLRNFENMLGRLLGEGIVLTINPSADPCRIKADPVQIEQVVTNLAVNARDAMPLGGRMTLETAVVEFDADHTLGNLSVIPGKYVRLSLTDTGGGMDKATMDRLFEPFFTTKPMGRGTGLGLATAYGIVKQSGGYIWVDSKPGTGTTFTICLPRTDEEPVAKVPVVDEAVPRGHGERVLVVEDEPGMLELCTSVLVRLGYSVAAARNGPEALRLVRKQGGGFDLVLTDVIMPEMSGAELAGRLREARPGLRVLYMSGYPDETIAAHGVLDPGTPFIQKPFDERTLAVKLRETLAGSLPGLRPGRRVLMIDDDEQFRELVRRFCTKGGHVFSGVDSAAAALAALAAQPWDVLLVDLNIPGTSGARVLREIRAAGHRVPAIALTGDAASADLDVLGPLGVVLVLEKSSEAGPLLQAIEKAGASNGRGALLAAAPLVP